MIYSRVTGGCGDLSGGPYTVIGSDPHRLDADGDGRGCEADG